MQAAEDRLRDDIVGRCRIARPRDRRVPVQPHVRARRVEIVLDEVAQRALDALDNLPHGVDSSPKLARSFRLIDRPCFLGHTHVPGVIRGDMTWCAPAENDGRFETRGAPCLVNVGSVGQPRDGDVRASYALFDGQTVTVRRVEYDLQAAVHDILATRALPPMLAQRLLEGW